MARNLSRFVNARTNIEVGKLSGAVGNFANNDPRLQTIVCKKLGLNESKISTQVISRDIYCEYFNVLALIGSTIEKIATEIRHLQRTEVGEVEESFAKGQKGSSAMPHKRNPIASENMCGCARILRGYAITSYENNSL
jgi:adenylosuccinate lyase